MFSSSNHTPGSETTATGKGPQVADDRVAYITVALDECHSKRMKTFPSLSSKRRALPGKDAGACRVIRAGKAEKDNPCL